MGSTPAVRSIFLKGGASGKGHHSGSVSGSGLLLGALPKGIMAQRLENGQQCGHSLQHVTLTSSQTGRITLLRAIFIFTPIPVGRGFYGRSSESWTVRSSFFSQYFPCIPHGVYSMIPSLLTILWGVLYRSVSQQGGVHSCHDPSPVTRLGLGSGSSL